MNDGRTVRLQTEEMTIEVKPGYSEKTVLTFSSKGNEAEGHNPSKLIIRFIQKPHETYRRKDDDLIYTHRITLEEALLSLPIKIKALDGRNLITTVDEIITP